LPDLSGADAILWDVEEEHFGEAEFLLERWQLALDLPHYTLRDLARGPERRALAHLDALAVGGPTVAARLLTPAWNDAATPPFRAAAALGALLVTRELDEVFAPVASLPRSIERVTAAGAAFALSVRRDLDRDLAARLERAQPNESLAILHGLAVRGADPGPHASHWLLSTDLELARAAARAIAWGDPRADAEAVERALAAGDPEVRRASTRAGLVFGLPAAWHAVTRDVEWLHSEPEALLWLALVGEASHWQLLARALESVKTRRAALFALGFSGRPEAVELCLPLLDDEKLAPLAAEAVGAIAGLPKDDRELWPTPKSDAESEEREAAAALPPLADDDLAAGLVPAAEERLPTPDAQALRTWWAKHAPRFEPGQRYLNGRSMTHSVVLESLDSESLRRRHVLALELAIRTRGAHRVPTRASAESQRAALARLAAEPRLSFQVGFGRF
jgi:uncharacterized protein (TIGR02270 family)